MGTFMRTSVLRLFHLTRTFLPFLGAFLLLTLLLEGMQAAAAATSLDVVIAEIARMGTADSANDEWITLYNNTAEPVDLTGWTLSAADGSPTINLSGSIPAGGYFLLERTDDTSVPGVVADLIYTGNLGNGGEDLSLFDATLNLIDSSDNIAAGLPVMRLHVCPCCGLRG